MLVETLSGKKKSKWSFKKAVMHTPFISISKKRRYSGSSNPTWNDVLLGTEILGKGKFLPGLTKALKNIGKFTSPITTGIAKTFLPAAVVNAAAKLDPTKKGVITPKAVQAAVQTIQNDPLVNVSSTDTSVKVNALMDTLKNPKVLAIIGGGVVLLVLLRKRG